MNGIKFDNIHSYRDLNLVLSKVYIPPAAVKTTYVDVPGADGSVDLTEALGVVRFKDRECSFTFTVFPYEDFEVKKAYVSSLLNGKKLKITVDKDPGGYWYGRCYIKEYESDKNLHKIVVGARVAPYKISTNMKTVTVPAGTSVTGNLTNSGQQPVVPTIITTAEAKIVFKGSTYNLNAGTNKLLAIVLQPGNNQVTVTSTAPVKFTYQEGGL